jgi:hypothetical protein
MLGLSARGHGITVECHQRGEICDVLRDRLDRWLLLSDGYAVANGDCQEWAGARNRHGYGITKFRWHQISAHRAIWLAKKGPIPAGLFVCHRCDNPPCINVDHLFLGTALDNHEDMVSKGRAHWQRR